MLPNMLEYTFLGGHPVFILYISYDAFIHYHLFSSVSSTFSHSDFTMSSSIIFHLTLYRPYLIHSTHRIFLIHFSHSDLGYFLLSLDNSMPAALSHFITFLPFLFSLLFSQHLFLFHFHNYFAIFLHSFSTIFFIFYSAMHVSYFHICISLLCISLH